MQNKPCADAAMPPRHQNPLPQFSWVPGGLLIYTHTRPIVRWPNYIIKRNAALKRITRSTPKLKPLAVRLLAHSKQDGNDLRRDRNRGLHIRSGHPVVPVSMSMWRQICRIDRRFERRRRHRGVSLMFVDGEGDFWARRPSGILRWDMRAKIPQKSY